MTIQNRKVIIVGAGHVGSHAAYALISQGIVDEIVFIDTDDAKAKAQALDLYDATVYLSRRVIVRAGDYSDAADAQALIVAAGRLPDMSKGETRMDTLKVSVEVIKDVVVNIRKSSFSGIILSITNPADVIAHYIQQKTGFPAQRVFSTSTTLDSSRLRRAFSDEAGRLGIDIDQKSVHAYVLGEHGESQVAALSSAFIGGKSLSELQKEQPETWGALDLAVIAEKARAGGWDILGGKGSTEFGIGAAIAEVSRAIFGNENRVLPVSTLLIGQYGEHDVYASVPAIVNREGVREVLELPLNDAEKLGFAASCAAMRKNFEIALTL
jgi:L-lactate dehydrogenase